MNHSYIRASDAVSADAVSTRAFLQQAVDHYPRLAAFSFTLALPYREAMSEYRSLILRFHSEVWQRTGEYSRQRQQARHRSLPTLLRWDGRRPAHRSAKWCCCSISIRWVQGETCN
jgi:hypothetical protein